MLKRMQKYSEFVRSLDLQELPEPLTPPPPPTLCPQSKNSIVGAPTPALVLISQMVFYQKHHVWGADKFIAFSVSACVCTVCVRAPPTPSQKKSTANSYVLNAQKRCHVAIIGEEL